MEAPLRLCRPLALAAAVAAGWLPAPVGAENSLTVVSFGGAYSRAAVKAVHRPFEEKTGARIRLEDYNGELAQIRTQVATGNVSWDVLEMGAGELLLACDEGLLEEIDIASLPPGADGAPAARDFYEDYILDCGVPVSMTAVVIAYNRERLIDPRPASAADFFDLERFPGRRGMRRHPLITLEFALMGDGVPRDKIYQTLSTPEGVARAFAKLDTIKEQVVWWDTGAQAPQMLADGEVAMSVAFNARIFDAQVVEDQPLAIVWDGHINNGVYKAVVAGTPRLELARQFVAFATSTESLARIAGYVPHGPLRASSWERVGRHLEEGVDMRPHLPNHHLGTAMRESPQWWADNLDDMSERFAAWLAR